MPHYGAAIDLPITERQATPELQKLQKTKDGRGVRTLHISLHKDFPTLPNKANGCRLLHV
jgi:hypothetical protein